MIHVSQAVSTMMALCCTFLVKDEPKFSLLLFFVFKSHVFDTSDRKRLAGRQNFSMVSTKRNTLMKVTLPVRYNKARFNYSKMLISDRMGIPDYILKKYWQRKLHSLTQWVHSRMI